MPERSRQAEWRDRQRGGPPRQPKPCGTIAAARRHQRRHEELCDACSAAWKQHQAAMYRRRKQRKQSPSGETDGPG